MSRLRRLALFLVAGFAVGAPPAAAAPVIAVNNGDTVSVGSRATINVTGLPPSEVFEIYIDAKLIGMKASDDTGHLSKDFVMPLVDPLELEHEVVVAERFGSAGASGPLAVSVGRWLQTGRNPAHTAEVTRKVFFSAADIDDLEVVARQKLPGNTVPRLALGGNQAWLTNGGRLLPSGVQPGATLGTSVSAPAAAAESPKRVYAVGTNAAGSLLYAYDGTTFGAPPVQKWRASLGGMSNSDPVIDSVNGLIFASTAAGGVRAFQNDPGNATYCTASAPSFTCTPVWRGNTGPTNQTPTVWNSKVFLATTNGHVTAFDDDCGTGGAVCAPIWDVSVPAGYHVDAETLTAASGYVLVPLAANDQVSGPTAALAFYNQATGVLVRQVPLNVGGFPIDRAANTPAATSHGVAYVGTGTGQLYAVNMTTGTIVWAASGAGADFAQPVVANRLVFALNRAANRLSAFPATCSTPCAPLTTVAVPAQSAELIVVDFQMLLTIPGGYEVLAENELFSGSI
jgi:outer membrane protein assembly factor BamB